MASPGLKRGSIQHFMASFEDFLCSCRRDEAVGCACSIPSSVQNVYLPRFALH